VVHREDSAIGDRESTEMHPGLDGSAAVEQFLARFEIERFELPGMVALHPRTLATSFDPVDCANTTPFAITAGSGMSKSPEIHAGSRMGLPLESPTTLRAIRQPCGAAPLVIGNFGPSAAGGPPIGTINHVCPSVSREVEMPPQMPRPSQQTCLSLPRRGLV